MTNFASGLLAAAGFDQLVVAPEGAIDQNEVAGGGRFSPFRIAAGQRRGDENAFGFLLEDKADGRVVGRERALEFFADVVRIRTAEWHRDADEGGCLAGAFLEMATEASLAGKHLP